MPLRPLAAPLVLALTSAVAAQDPGFPDAKTFDKLVVDTLRDVHNKGADLYNMKKDFEGTYRLYHGSLLTLRPLLGHRSDAQKLIDTGLAAAEKETSPALKAFRLHETIEAVRSDLKGLSAPKPVEKKKSGGKKPAASKPGPMPPAGATGGPGLRGIVTFKGQPLTGGDVILVSLDKPRPLVISAAIQANGQYAPTMAVPPGKYVVIVKSKHIPEKYHLTTSSGLEIQVKSPPTVVNIELAG